MGSRRGRHAALVALATIVASASACSRGAPPGFSDGDFWVAPLIGPLEDGLLLVPVLIHDKGPFVFSIDPDAHVSIIDGDVVKTTGAAAGEGQKMLDESDTERARFYAEILSWQIGTLRVAGPKPAQIVPPHTFDAGGRRIHGVLGRDIIAESLTLRIDRDAGTLMLSTQNGFKAPATATAIPWTILASKVANAEVLPTPRKLVSVTIGDGRFALHLDLGATPSRLRMRSWGKAKLVESELKLGLVDEAGMVREVNKQGVAASVSAGGATANDVVFVPYDDKRWPDQDIEGTLGLGFFRSYVMTVNFDQKTVYVAPRTGIRNIAQRIGRWQSKTLMSCANAGCVKLSLIDPLAGKPPDQMPEKHPGLVASFVRDAAARDLDLEILVAATPAEGKGPLKWLVVNMPRGTDRAMTHLPADYLSATLTVLDAGLFPRACPSEGACIDMLAPPQAYVPSSSGEPQNVPPSAVELRTGDKLIAPTDEEKVAVTQAGSPTLIASAKVCADATGKIQRVTLLKSSQLSNYDQRIVRTIERTWSYKPYIFNGTPIPFCTAVTFIYNQR